MSERGGDPEGERNDDNAPSDDDADAARGGADRGAADKQAADEEDAKPKKTPLYKRPLFWIIFIVATAALIVGALLWWLNARQYESSDDAFVDAHIVRIAPQVAGLLVKVSALDNRHVDPGLLLAVIEPSDAQTQVQQAAAGVAEAQAGVAQGQAQVTAAIAQTRQAEANAVAPRAAADKAAADLARYEALVRVDPAATAASQVDAARANARGTAAQAIAAERQAAATRAQIAVARRQVDAARAETTAAKARQSQASVTYGRLELRAPVAGQVVNRNVNIGSYVSPGQQIMAIVPDQIWITANFKETQLRLMRVGQHVDIKVDAYPNVKFEGHVDSVQHGAGQAFALLPPQNASGNYVKVVQRVPVRILFDRPNPLRYAIGPGMSVVPTVKVR